MLATLLVGLVFADKGQAHPPLFAIARSLEIRLHPWPRADHQGAVSLSFDDAYPSHCQVAMPLLEQHGFRGTFYVVVDKLRRQNKYLQVPALPLATWQNAVRRGHEIGSHTMSHTDLQEADIVQRLSELYVSNPGLPAVAARRSVGGPVGQVVERIRHWRQSRVKAVSLDSQAYHLLRESPSKNHHWQVSIAIDNPRDWRLVDTNGRAYPYRARNRQFNFTWPASASNSLLLIRRADASILPAKAAHP